MDQFGGKHDEIRAQLAAELFDREAETEVQRTFFEELQDKLRVLITSQLKEVLQREETLQKELGHSLDELKTVREDVRLCQANEVSLAERLEDECARVVQSVDGTLMDLGKQPQLSDMQKQLDEKTTALSASLEQIRAQLAAERSEREESSQHQSTTSSWLERSLLSPEVLQAEEALQKRFLSSLEELKDVRTDLWQYENREASFAGWVEAECALLNCTPRRSGAVGP